MRLLSKLCFSVSISLISITLCCAYNFCSTRNARTIFTSRPVVTDQTLELALTNYFIYHTEDPDLKEIYFTATPFYQETTRACDFGRYFLPQHKSSVTLRDCCDNRTRLRLLPERRVAGALLHARIDLHWFRHGSWLSINIAPVSIEHKLRTRYSTPEQDSTKDITVAALPTHNRLKHHKFAKHKLCDRGIDDVLIKFGFNVCRNTSGHVDLYTLFTFPLGRRCKNRSFFEPQVGTTHGSGGLGLNTDYILWQSCNQQLVDG